MAARPHLRAVAGGNGTSERRQSGLTRAPQHAVAPLARLDQEAAPLFHPDQAVGGGDVARSSGGLESQPRRPVAVEGGDDDDSGRRRRR